MAGAQLARVMRAVTWFCLLPLALSLFRAWRDPALATRLDAFEIAGWLVAAPAFYLGFRARPRAWPGQLTTVAFALLAAGVVSRIGQSLQVLVTVPFLVGAPSALWSRGARMELDENEEPIGAGHPLATAAMLERHAANLEAQGRATEAQKVRERAEKIRRKHDAAG